MCKTQQDWILSWELTHLSCQQVSSMKTSSERELCMSSSNDSRYLQGGLYLQSSKLFLVRVPEKWMSLDFSAALSARQLPEKEQCFSSAAFRADHWLLILDRKAIVCFLFLQPIDTPVSMWPNHPPQFHQSITMISLQDSGDIYKFYSSTKCMCGWPIMSRSVYNSKSVRFTCWWWLSIILPGLGVS